MIDVLVMADGWALGLLALAYFLGSVPFGLIVGRFSGLGNIRGQGSGNIGATNLLRIGGKKLGALTLFFDMLKGVLAVFSGVILGLEGIWLALLAAFAVIGHVFPVWLKFRGGKGVATYFGTSLMLAWPVGLAGLGLWLLTALCFRVSSLAALVSVLALPFIFYYVLGIETALIIGFASILVIVRHTANIRRLMLGIEPRIGETS